MAQMAALPSGGGDMAFGRHGGMPPIQQRKVLLPMGPPATQVLSSSHEGFHQPSQMHAPEQATFQQSVSTLYSEIF